MLERLSEHQLGMGREGRPASQRAQENEGGKPKLRKTTGSDYGSLVPGNPNASVLMQKVDPELNADAGVGAIMPQQFEPLSEDQIELLSTWVAEGAQNN